MLKTVHMFSWMGGLQTPLVQNDFNMLLDEWTSVKVLADQDG